VPGSLIQGQEEEVGFSDVLRGRTLWLLSLAEAVRFLMVTAVVIHVMPYLSSIGMSRATAALVATAIPLFSLIGRFGFGWLGDIFDKRYVLGGTYCLMGLGMLAFSYAHVGWLIFPFLILFSSGYGGVMSLRGAILREYFGAASFGRAVGILMGISSIGGIVGPALAGWTFDSFGSYHVIWITFSGLTGVAIAAILMIGSARISISQLNGR
jgi:MFS family permease